MTQTTVTEENLVIDQEAGMSLALGAEYIDTLTGFRGVATTVCINMPGEPNQVHLENGENARWFTLARVIAAPTSAH